MPVRVRQHLHLHMPRPLDQPLEIEAGVAERRAGLVGGVAQARAERLGVGGHADAAPAPAARGLDHQRIADLLGGRLRLGGLDGAVRARDDGHPGLASGRARCRLVPHPLHYLGRRADPRQPRLDARAREGGVLREEPIAGVNRVGAGALRGGEDRLAIEVAAARGRVADQHRLVGPAHVQRSLVGGRVDRDGPQPELAGRADHADRDLAAIGDQKFVHLSYCLLGELRGEGAR